jgi:AraC family transcriptional regulator
MALSEYIRRRRLSRAASDVLHTNEKIIDIAVKYGYESADAFSVAFKRAYNVSPSFARQNQVNLEPFHRLYYTLSIKYIKGDTKMKKLLITAHYSTE